jgi:3-methyladenine DNA glycosylase AlkD
MITQIGIASGEILTLIDDKKRPVSFSEIETHLAHERELTYMSIGWLVREGHVHLVDKGTERYLCSC